MRYLITGGSGYLGGRLTDELVARVDTELVVLADLRPPARARPKTRFVKLDVRDRESLRRELERGRVDALVHLAFILNPIHDEARMYDVDVNGTHAVLGAASDAGTPQVLVASSGVAYGAFPDNPRPIAEDWPVRGQPDFSYARDKADADRVCQLWAAQHPDRVTTIVRPCMVFGPNVDNYLSRTWENAPYWPLLDGADEEVQFVHEDDLVSALTGLLDARAGGAFNVCGDGTMRWSETAEACGIRIRRVSFRSQRRLSRLLWRLRFPSFEAPGGQLNFIRHPWVMSNAKLKETIGWRPRFSSRETFEITMRAKGILREEAPAGAPEREPAAV